MLQLRVNESQLCLPVEPASHTQERDSPTEQILVSAPNAASSLAEHAAKVNGSNTLNMDLTMGYRATHRSCSEGLGKQINVPSFYEPRAGKCFLNFAQARRTVFFNSFLVADLAKTPRLFAKE